MSEERWKCLEVPFCYVGMVYVCRYSKCHHKIRTNHKKKKKKKSHPPYPIWKFHVTPIQQFFFLALYCVSLRVRAVFHETVWVCHIYCNFKVGFTCRITVTFGTLKGGSLLITTLASNICFSYRNMFQNGVDALSKIVDAFLSKS